MLEKLITLFGFLFLVSTLDVRSIENIRLEKNKIKGFTLANAEYFALINSPKLAYSKQQVHYAVSKFKESKLKYLPVIGAVSNYNYTNNPVLVFSSLLMQQKFTNANFNTSTLNNPSPINNFLSAVYGYVPIFSGFQIESAIANSKKNLEKGTFSEMLQQQSLRYDLIAQFYAVKLWEQKILLLDNSIKSASARLKKIQDMHKTGMVTMSDVLKAQIEVSSYKQQYITAQGQLFIAKAKIASILGDESFFDIPLLGSITDKDYNLLDLKQYIELAKVNRFDIKMSNCDLAISKQNIIKARGNFLPKAGFYAAGINSGNAVVNGGSSFLIGAYVNIKVFDASLISQEKQARIAKLMAIQDLKQKQLDAYVDVVSAYKEYVSVQNNIALTKESIDEAKAALKIINDRYNVGLVDITQLLSAQNQELATQINYLDAIYQKKIKYAKLLLACGLLKDVNNF